MDELELTDEQLAERRRRQQLSAAHEAASDDDDDEEGVRRLRNGVIAGPRPGASAANGNGAEGGGRDKRALGTTSQRAGLLYGMEDSAAGGRGDVEAGAENKETVADHMEYTIRKQLLMRFYVGVCAYLVVSIREFVVCRISGGRGWRGMWEDTAPLADACVLRGCRLVLLPRSGDPAAGLLQRAAAERDCGAAVRRQVRLHAHARLDLQVRRRAPLLSPVIPTTPANPLPPPLLPSWWAHTSPICPCRPGKDSPYLQVGISDNDADDRGVSALDTELAVTEFTGPTSSQAPATQQQQQPQGQGQGQGQRQGGSSGPAAGFGPGSLPPQLPVSTPAAAEAPRRKGTYASVSRSDAASQQQQQQKPRFTLDEDEV